MTGIETGVLAVGKALAVAAGKTWLASETAESERSKDLVDLIKVRFADNIVRRRFRRQIDDIADSVAERLLNIARQEYRNMSDNDKGAVIAEVKDTLNRSDLSDSALFASDVDPIKLSTNLRGRMTARQANFNLGEAGAQFYEILLEECCDCLVRIVLQLPQFGPRATQDILARLSTLAANIDMSLSRLPARSLDAPQGRQDDAEFRRRYLEHISSTMDYSELFGINFDRYRRALTTLSVSYISLSVSTGANNPERRRADENLRDVGWSDDSVARESSTIRVETALGKSKRMMIRGEAGSGKTTLLRWLAVTAARGAFTAELEKWNGSVPFVVKLRSHAERGLPVPDEFLIEVADPIRGLMPALWVHRQLASGKAMLLVDGLDELAGAQRRAVRPWLAGLLTSYPEIQVVVTSRPAAASADWLAAEGFDSAFLERMSPADIKSLIRHWHLAAQDAGGLPCEPDELPSYESSLLARLESSSHLRVLAGTPLLAAMLCALNLDRVRQLPRDRMSLYAAALDMLLNRRDVERGVPSYQDISLETSQKIQIIQSLAWRLSTTNRSELPKTTAIQCVSHSIDTMPRASGLQAEALVNYLLQRSGVLREPIQGKIDFVHRTIQEYLTAKQVADEGDMDLLIRSAHKYQWQDTVIMAAGHANAPLRQELITGLLARVRQEPANSRRLKLVVAACLETLNSLPEKLAQEVDDCLTDLVPPRDWRSARSLAGIGEPVLGKLPQDISGLPDGAARATVRTAWLVNGPGAIEVLKRYRHDPREAVQSELMTGWRYFDAFEYVNNVLFDAPLVNGMVLIESGHCLPAVNGLKNLKSVSVILDEMQDLGLLNDVPSLQYLNVRRMLSDTFEPLTVHSRSLRLLSISEFMVEDCSPLSKLSELVGLYLVKGKIESLDFLSKLSNLETLRLGYLQQVVDFSVLRSLPLVVLDLQRPEHLASLSDLPLSDKLDTLSLSYSPPAEGLSYIVDNAPNIDSLTLDFCKWVSDLQPVGRLCNLSRLRLWGCKNVTDVSSLATALDLNFLDLDGTSVDDISSLASMNNLQTLWLKDCANISDLSPLASCAELRVLYMQGVANGIDLAPLANNNRLSVYVYNGQQLKNAEWLGRRLTRVGSL